MIKLDIATFALILALAAQTGFFLALVMVGICIGAGRRIPLDPRESDLPSPQVGRGVGDEGVQP